MKKIFLLLTLLLTIPLLSHSKTNTTKLFQHRIILSGKEVFNRTLPNKFLVPLEYKLLINNHWVFETGLSLNTYTGYINSYYFKPGYNNFFGVPIGVHLKFLGNQYGEYNRSANSIIPTVSLELTPKTHRFYAEIGYNFRFLIVETNQLWNIFYYQSPSTEAIFHYNFSYAISLLKGYYTIMIEFNNNDNFFAGNLGHYGFFLNNSYLIGIEKNFKLALKLGFRQAGSIALTATFYQLILEISAELRL